MLISWVEPNSDTKIFDKMVDNPRIYMLLEKGLVPDGWVFLKIWKEFKSNPKSRIEGTRIEEPRL